MAKKFLTHIDLNQNEIQNVTLQKLASSPSTPSDGFIYLNTTDDKVYLRISGVWKDITGELNNLISDTTALSITNNNDGTINLAISNATQLVAGLLSTTDKIKLDNGTSSATASTLVLRDSNGDASFNRATVNDITISNQPVNLTDGVNKSYVDNLVSSAINIQGGIDASTNPNFPAASKGDAYYITVAGKIGGINGEVVEVGDMIFANVTVVSGDYATVGSNWTLLQDNIDFATETIIGKIRLATESETLTGTLNNVAVSPLNLATLLNSHKYNVSIGDNSSTSFIITHGLNSTDLSVSIKDNATNEYVETDISTSSVNTITVSFNIAPTTNAYRIIIKK